jgi:ABC-type cobalamin/Fe3+-siderophores transport system ATPase subunit
MKLTLRPELGGYALPAIQASGIDGTVLDRPFVLFSGHNGSGKSAVMHGIRASVGLRGDRAGSIEARMERHIDPSDAKGDMEMLATHVRDFDGMQAAGHVPAVFKVSDLGWRGNPIHLFDTRTTSGIGSSGEFGDDMMFEASLLVGGGRRVSHGQFVSKAWWEAVEWAAGTIEAKDPWRSARPSAARTAVLEAALAGGPRDEERWLMIDEPETAIDVQTLLVGLSILLEVAEIGRLRVFCASHSLLFAAGLSKHPKVQTVDMGGDQSWMRTQEIAMQVANDHAKIASIGKDLLGKITRKAAARGGSSGGRRRRKGGHDQFE